MENKFVELYALLDPIVGDVRYIGKANNSANRLAGHCREINRRRTPLYDWMRGLAERGLKPDLVILAEVHAAGWQAAEIEMIASYRRDVPNGRLLNLAAGGDEPFCPAHIRAANGRRNSAARDPILWPKLRSLGDSLKRGFVTDATKDKIRANPFLFSKFARFL